MWTFWSLDTGAPGASGWFVQTFQSSATSTLCKILPSTTHAFYNLDSFFLLICTPQSPNGHGLPIWSPAGVSGKVSWTVKVQYPVAYPLLQETLLHLARNLALQNPAALASTAGAPPWKSRGMGHFIWRLQWQWEQCCSPSEEVMQALSSYKDDYFAHCSGWRGMGY
jgi:hypothetical protein